MAKKDVNDICRDHLAAAIKAAGSNSSADVVGRAMLSQIIAVWRQERSIADIKSELEYAADNLDPDEEYVFMRP